MTLRRLGELTCPVPVFGETEPLEAAVQELSVGRPALVRVGSELVLVAPSDAVGHHPNRRLVDLPSSPVRAQSPDTLVLQALAHTEGDEFIVTLDAVGAAAITSRAAILEALLGTDEGGADALSARAAMLDVLDQSLEGIVVLDASRRVRTANRSGQRMLETLSVLAAGGIVNSIGGVPLEALIEDARHGTPRDVAVSEPARHIFTVRTVSGKAPESQELVLVLRDVTHLRHRQAREAEQERMAILGHLAAGIIHDLNNLLTVVMGEASLLRLEATADESRSRTAIEDASARAARLVRQLLAFARRELGDPVSLDLRQTLDDSREILQRLVGSQRELVFDVPEVLDTVLADPVQIERILTNLVDNAARATPAGGRIRVTLANEPHCSLFCGSEPQRGTPAAVQLSVEDTGIGMDAETARCAFEPHFTTRGRDGTGLGLATVRATVSQLGGQIRLTTAPGSGTRFDIYLPSQVGINPARSIVDAPAPPRGRLSGRLLVLEEQTEVAEFIVRALRHSGYHVDLANTVETAVAIAEDRGEPDLFIVDVFAGAQAGVNAAQRLRERFSKLRVLLMCGISHDELLREANHPLVEYIAKPFGAEELLSRVAAIVGDSVE
ncbi:MAG: response regulator [Polyangiaceae bacterium]|nr:response regulator [Polyangiaceae bacterium]